MGTIATVILALVSLALTSYGRKIDEKEKPRYLVWGNIACLAGIIILNAVSQLNSSNESNIYKQHILELDVLSKVNEFAIPVFERYAIISNNFVSVKNYINVEQAKELNPDAISFLERQQEQIKSTQSFQDLEKALEDLKSIAAKIHGLHLQYGNIVPKEIIEWANIVLEIELEGMDEYFDPYVREGDSPRRSVLNFFELSGNAFGLSIGKVRLASESIVLSVK